MNQVGDDKTFYVAAHTSGARYVWKYWDGATAVSAQSAGSNVKRLNLGGNPAEGFTVPVRCEVVDPIKGETVYITTGRLPVNNQPTLYGSPTVSNNDAAFPYQTTIAIRAYDLEDAGIQFLWYSGSNPVSGLDTTSASISVEGTYYGTLTGLTRQTYLNQFSTTIYGSGTTMTCKIIDGDAGTRRLNFDFRGYDPAAPSFSVAATPDALTAQATALTTQFIAPGQVANLSAYAYDPVPGQLVFTWDLNGTNGWSAPDIPFIYANDGTSVEQGYKSEWQRQLEDETVGGRKRVIVWVTNPTTNKTTSTYFDINTAINQAPSFSSVDMYDPISGEQITSITKAALPTRTLVRFSGTASDPNSDVVTYKWDFTVPVSPSTYTLYGRDAFVDVSDWPSGAYSTLGIVTAYDRFEQASSPANIPSLTVT